MFDDINLQICEDYECKATGADRTEDLYKRPMGFMIVGLGSNVQFLIVSSPAKKDISRSMDGKINYLVSENWNNVDQCGGDCVRHAL